MKKLASLLLLATVTTAGCYHATIETGRQPSGQTVERDWAHSFLGGLVPPSVTETAQQCPNGVARVETQLSFLNMVANALTFGIYSPMTIEVACAAADDDADSAALLRQTDDLTAEAVITRAVVEAHRTGQPVTVDLR